MKVPILIPNIFNHPFTYDSDLKLKIGDYVVVPFGKSELTGVVWDDFEKKTNKNFAIKKVSKKLNVPDKANVGINNKLKTIIPKIFFMNSNPTKPLIRCLGDGASENNNTLIDHKSTIEFFRHRP